MRLQWILVALMVAAMAGCGGSAPSAGEADRRALEAEVRAADEAFNRAVQEGDLEAFADLVANDAVFYGSTAAIAGRDQVVEAWRPFFDPSSGSTISWTPHTVDVSSSGDFGYTRGEYRMEVLGEDGAPGIFGGSYVTIWRREADGAWRAVVDIGTPSQPLQGR